MEAWAKSGWALRLGSNRKDLNFKNSGVFNSLNSLKFTTPWVFKF